MEENEQVQQAGPVSSEPGPALQLSTLMQLDELSLSGDGEPFSVRIAKVYLTTSVDLIARLKEGSAKQDAEAICFAAHTLKSGSAMLGGVELAAALARLEALALKPPLQDPAPLVDFIDGEYLRVCRELETYIGNSEGAARS